MSTTPYDAGVDFDRFARFYDWDTAAEVEDVDFYRELARRAGDPVLDVGCGTGRVLARLASSGRSVTGIDVSSAMLARASRRLRDEDIDARVRLIHGDACAMRLDERFALAFIALNTFMHFTTGEAQRALLGAIHTHLRPRGLLAFDVFNPHPDLLAEADGRLIHDFTRAGPDPGSVTSRFHSQYLDPTRQRMEITFFYDEARPDGSIRRTIAPFDLRYVTYSEVQLLLPACGFVIENAYGDFDLSPYEAQSSRLIVVARRV